jgi:hypothetical protein
LELYQTGPKKQPTKRNGPLSRPPPPDLRTGTPHGPRPNPFGRAVKSSSRADHHLLCFIDRRHARVITDHREGEANDVRQASTRRPACRSPPPTVRRIRVPTEYVRVRRACAPVLFRAATSACLPDACCRWTWTADRPGISSSPLSSYL